MERLTEAIEKYKELSKEKDCLARTFRGFRDYGNPKSTITSGAENNQNLSEEYAQLAEWLEELSQYKELLPTPQMVKDLINMNRKHEKNALENAHIVDDYRQKQNQGLLIELKVPLGTQIWYLEEDFHDDTIKISCGFYDLQWLHFHKDEDFYLTKDKAEEALARMKGE